MHFACFGHCSSANFSVQESYKRFNFIQRISLKSRICHSCLKLWAQSTNFLMDDTIQHFCLIASEFCVARLQLSGKH